MPCRLPLNAAAILPHWHVPIELRIRKRSRHAGAPEV
jgi:hypothetical protein